MGAIVASTLIARARRLLQDESNVAQRWADSVLLGLLNEGQVAIARMAPAASSATVAVTLTGAVRQALPADSMAFIRLTCNLLADGATPSYAISPTSVATLDLVAPLWRASAGGATRVLQAASDPSDDNYYYVYPPVAGAKVELQYVRVPAVVATTGSSITINDGFQTPLVHYIVYKALEQDSDNEAGQALAELHLKNFTALILGSDPTKKA